MALFKRILALLLAASMLVAELPTAALAQMLEETAVEEVLAEPAAPAEESTEESIPEDAAAVQTTGTVTEGTIAPSETETQTQTEPSVPETTAATEETTVSTEAPAVDVLEATEPAAMAEGIDDLTYSFDEESGILTISGTGDMENCAGWDEYRDLVEVVVVEEGVTGIYQEAFADMSGLTLVLLPNSLTTIGDGAFRNCTDLSDIIIPAGVTTVGQEAFAGCSGLGYVEFYGENVTIGENAFSGVNATVCYPWDISWSDYSSYGGTLQWAGNMPVTETGLYGSSRWLIYQNGYLNLVGRGTLEAQSSAAGYPWHAYADSATGVSIVGVENVPQYAFDGFEAMTSIRVREVSTVDAGAFRGCTAVQTVNFASFFDIASDAFTGVTASVNYEESDGWTEDKRLNYGGALDWTPVYTGTYGDIDWEIVGSELSLYGNYDSPLTMESQTSAEGYPWYAHRDRIETAYISGSTVGDYAFDGYTGLTTVQLNSLPEIGTAAFRGCTALTDVTFHSAPPSIAADAFTGVTATVFYDSYSGWTEENRQDYGGTLTWKENTYEEPELASGTHGDNATWTLSQYGSLTVTGEGEMASMTSAEDYGWYEYRDQIQNVTVTGLTSVGDYAFAGYPALTSLDLDESVTKVGSRILEGSETIYNVHFDCSCPEIAEDAFAGLTDVGILYPYRYQTQWAELVDQNYGGTDIWWSVYVKSIAGGPIGTVGTNGPEGYWNLMENGDLNFNPGQSETFAIPDMEEGGAPWNAYLDQITGLSLYGVSSVGVNAFAGCTALTYAYIPETVTAIGANAFAGCSALKTVRMNSETVTIGENAFRDVTATVYYCYNWDSSLLQNYGGTLTWELESTCVDSGIQDGIGWNFWSDGSLSVFPEGKETVAMPSYASAEEYPWHAYAEQATSLSVSRISSIGDYAFAGFTGLTDFIFTYHITALGNNIFKGCTNLTELAFHGSAPEFSENTFYGVTATVVEYPTGDATWTADKLQNWGGTIDWGSESGGEVVGPAEPSETEPAVTEPAETEPALPENSCGENLSWEYADGTLTISGTGAMTDYGSGSAPWYEYCREILNVEIRPGVTSIGTCAFMDCSSMESISIPDSVTDIGAYAFSACSELTAITLPLGITKIEDQTFSGCVNLAGIRIPEGVTEIGVAAFMSCFIGLTEITIPASVTAIGGLAFSGCSALTSITMEGDAPTIANNALDGVTATIYYPANNDSWTEDVLQQYGGTVVWESVDSGETGGDDVGVETEPSTPAESEPAETEPEGGEDVTWELSGDGTLTVSGYGDMADYELGEAPWYEDRDQILRVEILDEVTSIGSYAFYECGSVTEVVLSGNIMEIGTGAFSWCESLTEVEIPEGVQVIYDDAFSWCRKLTSVTIPDSVVAIGGNAFTYCDRLTAVTIPENVLSIGDGAFCGCAKLTSVTIPAGVTSIGNDVFLSCGSLTEIAVESGNAHFSNDAQGVLFDKAMTTLLQAPGGISGTYAIPESVTAIDGNAFQYCRSLTGVTIPKGVVSIGDGAFNGCTGLTEVTVPGGISEIGYGVFSSCTALNSVTVSENTPVIGQFMFGYCYALTDITMEGSAPAIAEDALYGVTATVYYPINNGTWTEEVMQQYGGTITWEAYEKLLASGTCGDDLTWELTESGTLTVSGTGDMYCYDNNMLRTEWYWDAENVKRIVIEEGVTSVGDYAFYGDFGNVTEISLPDSLVSIGYHAFEDCKNVTELEFGSKLESIGGYAFISMGLTGTLALPDSLKSIGEYAFRGCTGLTAVELGSGVESIGDLAFGGCSGLESITMTGDAPAISDTALQWVTTTVYYPISNTTWTEDVKQNYGGTITWVAVGELTGECGENLTWTLDAKGTLTISGTGAMDTYTVENAPWYEYRYSITELVLEEGITNIGEAAFYDCCALTSVECPDSLLTIEKFAFQMCTGLETVSFNEGLQKIRGYSFESCDSLTAVEFPESLIYIGGCAFMYCTGLTGDLVIPGNASVAARAFSGCSGFDGTLTVLPGEDKYIDQAAFRGCSGFTGLMLGEGITKFGDEVFDGCTGLTGAVTIPASVTTMGADVFDGCSGIGHIRFESVDCPAIEDDSLGTLSGLASLFVPGENYASYEALIDGLPDTVIVLTDWEYFPVTGLTVEHIYSRTAVLYWDEHRSGEEVEYIVLRDGTEIGRTTDCTYADRTLEPETAYTYTVKACFEDGRLTPPSDAITAETVLPEITQLSGYVEYAGIKKFADVCNTVWVAIANKDNLAMLDGKTYSLGLYYSNGGEETLIGWADTAAPRSVGYTFNWDVSLLSDGEYTLRAVLTDVDGTTAEWTETVTVDNTPPAKLQQLSVVGSETNIVLNWTEAQEYDTVGYHIYRRVSGQEEFSLLKAIDGRAVLTYTDTTAGETDIYDYYVVGVDIFDREAWSYEIVAGSRIADEVKPRVLQLLPVSGSVLTGTASFSVKAEDNVAVDRTKVEYSNDEEATWTELTAENGRYALDTTALADGTVSVRAYAYDAAGNESDAFKQTYLVDNTGPEAITWQESVVTSVTLTLRWADVEAADIGGFRVEQKQSDGSWKIIAEKVTALGHNLRGLMPGTDYTFRVTAYDIYGNFGEPSEEYTITTAADTTAPVTAQLLPASGAFADIITLSATVEDDYSIASAALEYSSDGISWTALCSETYTGVAKVRKISGVLDLTEIPEGLLYIRATAADQAGNTDAEPAFVQHMVDKTAPDVPANVTATGHDGYVEVQWASVAGAASYKIWRGSMADGVFTLVSDDHRYLNYIDRNVEDGEIWYYQVAAVDTAGNVGQRCEAVSAQANPDTQVPEILSVSPADGSVLSSTFAQVSALVKDNSALYSIMLEYSHDGEAYAVLTEVKEILSYGTTAAAGIPMAEFGHGDTVWLRVSATDCAGNTCEAAVYTYTVDAQAPTVSSVTAQYNDGTVLLSWTGGAEEDLVGYRIYRRNEAGTTALIAQVAAAENQTGYTWTDDSLPVSGGTFTYQIEAVDAVGNTATGSSTESVPGENTPSVEVPERTGPTALLDCDAVMTVGMEYIIDGSGSTDDGQIVSYSYDFGDGTTGTGKSLIHAYSSEGTYKIVLTVTDNDGNSATFTRKVTVKAPELVGNVTVRIIDEKGAPVPNAPVYFDLGDEEKQVIRPTNASGYVTFTAEAGRHTVGCVILNNEWLPVKRDLIVKAGETTSVSMTLVNKPIVEGTFEIKRMTLEEIEAAGIDLSDPANQYYVEVELHLEYKNAEYSATIPGDALSGKRKIIFATSGTYEYEKEDDDEPDPVIIRGDDGEGDDDDDDDVRCWSVELIDKSKDPKLMILDIPIGVRSLKEMFDVRLHILNNSSSEFSMLDNVITLDTPSGLSVVTDAYGKAQQTAHVAEIKGQTQKTVEWIVRGDQPGEYTVGADYSGILSQFNEPLTARFEAQESIEVYGMSGMKLEIVYADQLDKGTLYYNVMLTNDGEEDIYKPSISTADILIEAELYDQAGFAKAKKEDFSAESVSQMGAAKSISGFPDILKAGESLIVHYMCIDQTDYTHCEMKLKEAALEYQNTFGLLDENIEYYSKPLSYFKGNLSTSINPVEKAKETLAGNVDAYTQLMDNYRYICWCLANDMVADNYLPEDSEEMAWELAQGEFLTGHKKDVKQAEALILEILALTAEASQEIQCSTCLEWAGKAAKIIRECNLEEAYPITRKQKEALADAFETYGETFEMTYDYMVENKKSMNDLLVEYWEIRCEATDVKFVGKDAANKIVQETQARQEMVNAWKEIGIGLKVAEKIVKSLEETSVDATVYLKAQANVETYLFLLDEMLAVLAPEDDESEEAEESEKLEEEYTDVDVVVKALKNVRKTIQEENLVGRLADHVLENLTEAAVESQVEWATDELLEIAGATATGIFKVAQVAMKLTAVGLDALMNVSEQYKMADNIKFVSIMSDAAALRIEDAKAAFTSNQSVENAENYMKLLALMLDLRALGESQAALYGKSFETDYTIGNLPLLKAVRKMTDAEEATSWYQWRNIVEDRISRLRVQLLRNPVTTEITGRTRPTVSFDYRDGQTIQSFDASYEYSLDMGTTWTVCSGSPIEVPMPDTSVELWVRKVNRANTDMQGTGSVIIYGPQRLYTSGIEVLKTESGYRIENLNADKNYQMTFSATPLTVAYDTELDQTIPEGSCSYTVDTDSVYNYVYIRTTADRTGFASHISGFQVVSTVSLKTFVTGEGTIADHDTVWEYGSQVSVTATPAANRVFDGWYRNGTKVSSVLTYTFNIYSSMYLEARFRELEALPGVSAPVNAEDGSASVTTEEGTTVSVSGAPETADTLVVETVTDTGVQSWVAGCLADIGLPAQILDIYAVDAYRNRDSLKGAAVKLESSGITDGMLLCGIAEDGTATVLDSSFQDGAIGFTCDDSMYYVLTSLHPDRYISVEASAETLLPSQKAQLSAEFLPGNPTGAKLQWSMAEGDDAYATLKASGATATLTALSATGSRDVTVTVSAADGSFPSTAVQIRVMPYVHQLTLHTETEDVTGQKIQFDINGDNQLLELTAVVAPADAVQELLWSSSDETIAEVAEGLVTFTGKTGTVKITATATDGSKKSAVATVQVVALTQNVAMAEDSVTDLVGGNSATFTAVDADTGVTLTKSQLTWSLDEEYASYAAITAAGKLTTRAVAEETPIVIVGKVIGNEEVGVVEHTVTLHPEVTLVELYHDGQVVNGETILVDTAEATENALPTVQLEAVCHPDDVLQGVTWKSLNTSVAEVDEDGLVTVKWDAKKGACKTGAVTVTATAADGSKVSGSVKLNFGVFVKEILIEAPEGELRSGQKMTLTAETVPAAPTKGGVTWSLAGEDDGNYATITAAGKLTAKTVYDDYTVTVRATAKDGSGVYAEYPVKISPKTDGILTIHSGEKNVTKTTVNVDLDGGGQVVLEAFTDDMRESVTWKSSSKTAADLVDNGDGTATVTMLKTGATTVTATAADGRTATVTLKAIRMTKEITVGSKTGEMTVASGKSLTLTATVLPSNATTRTVLWSLAPEDADYATISTSGKLTAAKNLTEARTVTVTAAAKDGGATASVQVLLTPLATGVSILLEDMAVANTTRIHNMADNDTLQLEAKVYPLGQASGDVTWKSSNAKIASVDEDGQVTCLKAGTVTITATANDGSKQKASFKLTVEKWMSELTLPDTAVIAGGKTLTITKLAGYYVDAAASNKNLIWTMEGEGAAFATLSNKGVLKTKKVTEAKTLTVTATAADAGGIEASCEVTIYPATTKVQVLLDGEAVTAILTLAVGETLDLDGTSLPVSAAEAYTWKSSAVKYAEVDEEGVVTALQAGKTVSITCLAADGSGKSAVVKIKTVAAE